MIPIEKTIESIKLLIASGDLSDSLHLRQLHKACMQAFKDLNANLDRCRDLMENGAIQAARELNNSFDPPLTQVAEHLEYFKTNDFFAVCKGYGLDVPTFPDEQLLMQLNTPFSSGEKRLHALLQDYRKIARNGSMRQRIGLLRKIVRKLPRSARWRGDLISAEHSRCQEIERELKQLDGGPECCGKLEDLYREVSDPEWITPPGEELVAEIGRMLRPLQQAKLNQEVETKLQQLQELWIERDIPRLGKALEQWRIFSSSPIIHLTDEQRQTVADIESFFNINAEEEKKQRACKELIRKIEQRLADNAPFADVKGDYNQLQVMDCPLPPALADRLAALEEENRRGEYLRNVRRCIYGVCGAVLLGAAVVLAVSYTQYYLSVKRNSSNMQAFLDRGQYKEVIALYDKLNISDPRIASSPRIIRLHTIAEKKIAEAARSQQGSEEEFKRLIAQIEELSQKDVLDNADALTADIDRATEINEKNPQPKELLDKFSSLKTDITRRRTELKQRREREFMRFCDETVNKINVLIGQIPKKEPKGLDVSLDLLKKEFQTRSEQSPYVPDHLKKQKRQEFDAAVKQYSAAWKRELAFRGVNAPADFDKYLAGLEKIYEYPDLLKDYRRALDLRGKWKREYENYQGKIPRKMEDVDKIDEYGEGMFKNDLKRVIPKQNRSREFSKFVADMAKQKDLKELILTGADGKQFFFYVDGDVRLEKLKAPPRVNISFKARPVGQEKNSFFAIRYSEKNKPAPFALISIPKELPYKIPKNFALLDGHPAVSQDACRHLWPGGCLTTDFKLEDGPGLNYHLQAALRFICGDGNVKNVYLKEMLLIIFLKELYENSPAIYPEVYETLQTLRELQKNHHGKYYAPQAVAEYDQDRVELEAQWAKLDLERLLNAGKMRVDFVCGAHARRLVPAGVIRKADGNGIEIHLFESAPPCEGSVMVFDGDKGKLLMLPPEVWQGRMPRGENWPKRLFKGQVIWSFEDGKKSEEFLREWKQKARALNVELKIMPNVIPADKE